MAAAVGLSMLAACGAERLNPFARDSAAEVPAITPLAMAAEAEAPAAFDLTAEALWDGRPSLGGVWIAHPDIPDPERVVIRDPETGRSVTGALFRRERELPGPPFQVSSDAADALGLVAGMPTTLRVTAIQRNAPDAPAAEPQGTSTASAGEASQP
jgi:hypothetical protein